MKQTKFLPVSVWLIFAASTLYSLAGFCEEMPAFDCTFQITEGHQSVRTFTLTEDVYQCMKFSGHRDLLVVNKEQQIVPFRLLSPTRELDVTTVSREFTFYREPDASAYKTGDQIRRIAGLTGIASGNETDTQWQEKNTYYSSLILQRQETDANLKRITINIKPSDVPVNATVVLESSDDLQHWTMLRSPYNLLFLQGENAELRGNVLDITQSKRSKYLRLASMSNIENFVDKIASITGEYTTSSYKPVPVSWFSVGSLQALEEKNAWHIPLKDLRSVSKMRFTLADNIVFYQGKIFYERYTNPDKTKSMERARGLAKNKIKSLIKNTIHDPHVLRSTPTDPWHMVTNFTQYKMSTGSDTLTSPDVSFYPVQSKSWKIRFKQPQKITQSQLPKIELGWIPPKIVFVAQGRGPFTLLVGSENIPSKPNLPQRLLSVNQEVEEVALLNTRSPRTVTAPSKSTGTESDTGKMKQVILWVILVLGVIVMVGMAYQLAKKMKAGDL